MRQTKKKLSSPEASGSAPTAAPKALSKAAQAQAPESAEPIRSTSQLARELGLSRWTISRVINGHPGIHPDTVERVRAAMEKHRFSPNPLAQGLRHGRTNLIGICAPGIEDYFLGPKLELLREALSIRGFQVMIGITGSHPEPEATTLDHFRRLCVAGVILFASRLSLGHAALSKFREAEIPLVMVDPLAARHPHSLGIDRARASQELMAHLLGLGHRHFITVCMANAGLYTRTRLNAISAALEKAGLPPERHLLHLTRDECEDHYEAGYESAAAMAELLKGDAPDRPTAILAMNDRIAIGMMEGLRQRGYALPRDCSIAGYDNMEHTAYISPRLTTIDPGAAELMARAASQLLAAMKPGSRQPRPIAIKPRLIIRETTAAPPEKRSTGR